MTHDLKISRRLMLGGALALTSGLSLTYASRTSAQTVSGRNKTVFIIARGAMDGLSVVVPHGDADYRRLRGDIAIGSAGEVDGALDIGGGFGLHPALQTLHGLHGQNQLRVAPAVAIPTRIRSHFDAQDVLEGGLSTTARSPDGWLNRAVAASGERGLSIGSQTPLVMRGTAETSSWAPGGQVGPEDRVAQQLMDLYADDPLLGPALSRGLDTGAQAMLAGDGGRIGRNDSEALAKAVARLMVGPEGSDLVALSLDGWDTHARQLPLIRTRLTQLDGVIAGLKEGLGAGWRRTVVIVATEFGRTARVNGTNGTDHGTGSALLLVGGALKPGGMIGNWPGLADNRLFEGRDLMPTLDVRSVFKGVLRDHVGIDRAVLDRTVFPDSGLEAPAVTGLV